MFLDRRRILGPEATTAETIADEGSADHVVAASTFVRFIGTPHEAYQRVASCFEVEPSSTATLSCHRCIDSGLLCSLQFIRDKSSLTSNGIAASSRKMFVLGRITRATQESRNSACPRHTGQESDPT